MTGSTRRSFIRTATIAASSIAFAGCSSSSGSTSTQGQSDGGSGGSSGGSDGSDGSSSGSKWTQTKTVKMTDKLTFAPKRIQVPKGTTVTWKNTGSIGHTVTAYEDEIPDGAAYFASGGFESEKAAKDGYSNGQKGNIPKGESYSHTFETKGTYKYFCIPHEMNGMVGYVKVV